VTGRAVAAVAAVAALAAAGSADAAVCDQRAQIRQRDAQASLAVGDSVMLAAANQLAAYGFSVDAQACRRFDQGLVILRERPLPELVVVALGSNASVTAGQIESALQLIGPHGRLVLVIPRAPGGFPDPDRAVIEAAARAHPDRIGTLDWPSYSAAHADWFGTDGLHLRPSGADAFADFIAGAGSPGQADSLGPPPEPVPQPEKPRPVRPPQPHRSQALAGLWESFARTIAAVVAPAIRLLGEVVGPPPRGSRDEL
jgi:hypothetical protein